jgi:putative NADH-flavin reductase
MRVLVIGATGGSGRAAIDHLLAAGHRVTAFVRRPDGATNAPPGLSYVQGDAMRAEDIERTVEGHDAVVVTLGITENPLRVRFFGPKRTPLDVRSRGTRSVIAAMKKHGVRKLVVQTTYGLGDTRERLGFVDRMFFRLVLTPQIADTEIQTREVRESGLDWVLVQPVHLTDDASDEMPFVSFSDDIGGLKVSRRSVGRVLAAATEDAAYIRRCVSVSGRPETRAAVDSTHLVRSRQPR